jgi:hypothetical protein
MATDAIMTINRLGFADSEMQDFAYLRTLAYADFGAASAGEVVYVARKIARDGGGREAFVQAWTEQGRLAARMAGDALAAGRPLTARTFLHRAYNYLRTAEFYFDRHEVEEFAALYEESVSCFDRALPMLGTPAERIAIPYQDGVDLPGYFFAADDSGPRAPPSSSLEAATATAKSCTSWPVFRTRWPAGSTSCCSTGQASVACCTVTPSRSSAPTRRCRSGPCWTT